MSKSALKIIETNVHGSNEAPTKYFARDAAAHNMPPNVRTLCSKPRQCGERTVEEIQALILRYRPSARKLAISMVMKWRSHIDPLELQSITDFALCEAASRFDASIGAAFMTFLYYHLKGLLIKHIVARQDSRLVFVESYENSRGSQHDEQHSERGWIDRLALADTADDAETRVCNQEESDCCRKAWRKLPAIERQLIEDVYLNQKPLAMIAAEIGYSRGHLFRVRRKALSRMRRALDCMDMSR